MKEKILFLLTALAIFAVGFLFGRRDVGHGVDIGHKPDTVYITKTVGGNFPAPSKVSTSGYIPIPIPRYVFMEPDAPEPRTDTLTFIKEVHDTTFVYVPRELKYYDLEDGSLRIWASGYGVNIDRYEMDMKTEIIRKKPRFNISLSGGYGIGKDGMTRFIGITAGYNLLSF